jgi:hypothetical protein
MLILSVLLQNKEITKRMGRESAGEGNGDHVVIV